MNRLLVDIARTQLALTHAHKEAGLLTCWDVSEGWVRECRQRSFASHDMYMRSADATRSKSLFIFLFTANTFHRLLADQKAMPALPSLDNEATLFQLQHDIYHRDARLNAALGTIPQQKSQEYADLVELVRAEVVCDSRTLSQSINESI